MALSDQDMQTQIEGMANAPDPKTDAPHPMVGATPAPPNLLDAAKTPPPAVPTPSFLDNVLSSADAYLSPFGIHVRQMRDLAEGAITDTVNTVDSAKSFAESSARGLAAAEDPEHAEEAEHGPDPFTPMYDHARGAVLNFRDALAVKDPSLQDNLIKGAGQFLPSFLVLSRVIGGIGGLAKLAGEPATGLGANAVKYGAKLTQFAAADAATSATVNAPHDPRLADAVSLMMHSEGQFGNLLREVAPDGVQHFINYLADHENEGEAEGRWKNVVDGWGAGAALNGVLRTGGSVLKQGWNVLHFMADNNMGSMGDLTPPTPGSQRGAVGDLTKPQDTGEALQDAVLGKEPPFGKPNQGPSAETIPDAGLELAPSPKRPVSSSAFPSVMVSDEDLAAGTAQNRATVNTLRNVLQKFNDRGGAQSSYIAGQPYGEGAALHPILQNLSKGISRDTPQGAFYGDVLDRLVAKNLNTKMVASGTGFHAGKAMDNFGTYDASTDTMSVHQPALDASNQSVLHTFVHEAVHAATMKEIITNPDTAKALDSIRKEALAASKHADTGSVNPLATLSDTNRYGLTNVKELAAEIESNQHFRQAMKMTESSAGGSLWDQYKRVIGHILGVGSVAVGSKAFDKLITKQESDGA